MEVKSELIKSMLGMILMVLIWSNVMLPDLSSIVHFYVWDLGLLVLMLNLNMAIEIT